MVAAISYPVFYALNRPSMTWFADLAYDFALRCSGIAITFGGQHGLTSAEEKFLERNARLFQSGHLFDVGANNGAYSRFLRRIAPAAAITAFEPHPTTFATLCRNVSNSQNITTENFAVSDTSGSLTLFDFRQSDGSTQASLSEDAVALYSSDLIEHSVRSMTIDEYMLVHGIENLALLKIDTEGHDLAVLQGAKRALAARKIAIIQFEFIPANIATGVTMHRFFEALQGYKIGRLCMNGTVRPFTKYDVKRCEIFITHNLIAVPVT